MFIHVQDAHYVKNFTVWVSFDDGIEGTINLKDFLKGQIFEPLQDVKVFKEVFYDPTTGTICWPNGADFAPEFLRKHIVLKE
ncbi:MAG: DUF2442 domain-containing protein [Alphaproteobacteria bacterium]